MFAVTYSVERGCDYGDETIQLTVLYYVCNVKCIQMVLGYVRCLYTNYWCISGLKGEFAKSVK